MDKLSINDLEEGKIYTFSFADNMECAFVHRIKNNRLQVRATEKATWEESNLSYNNAISGYFTEIKREINWVKVPRGTKIQVRDYKEEKWYNRYFVEYDPLKEFPFYTNKWLDDDYTGFKMEEEPDVWRYCRIHESVQIPDDWYKEEK